MTRYLSALACLVVASCSEMPSVADAPGTDAGAGDARTALDVPSVGDASSDTPSGSDAGPLPMTDCAPTRWVTVDAAGGGDGSMARPWTLAEAMASAGPGDVVEVGPGTYDAPATGTRYEPAWNPASSGTVEAPIVFCARHPAVHSATERSELRATGGAGPSPTFGTHGRDHVTWDGFFVNEADSPSTPDTGPVVVWDSEDVTISRCLIQGATIARDDNHNGIRLEVVRDVRVIDNRIVGIRNASDGGYSRNHAGIMTYDASHVVIEHNEIADCDSGMYLKGDHEGDGFPNGAFSVRSNWIHDIELMAIAIISVDEVDGTGSEIAHNFIHDTSAGLLFTDLGGLVPAQIDVHHNTFVDTTGIAPFATTMYGVTIRDNLVAGSVFYYTTWDAAAVALVTSHGFSSHHNFGDPGFRWIESEAGYRHDLTEWRAFSSFDVRSVVGDSMIDRATGRLAAGSPARTASSSGGPVGCSVVGDEIFGVRPPP